jgi:hypothetical protein
MPRHNGSSSRGSNFTVIWHQPSRSGKVPGRGLMKRRRAASGMSRDDFAAVLRRTGIRGRN